MSEANASVGMVGLGIMGSAMSGNLVEAGYPVLGYDIDQSRVDQLVTRGGHAAASARGVAEASDVVLTSLPSVEAFEAVAEELAEGVVDRLVVAELSTLPLDVKQRAHDRLAKAGVTLLDCPLSGTGAQAVTKDLVMYASGDREAVERCAAVFAGFTRAVHYLGGFGAGTKMKFVANLLVSIHNLATAEAFVLGMKAGLDPQAIFDVISSGAGTSRIFELRGPMMVTGDYSQSSMKMGVYQKDIKIISAFAAALDCPTPLLSATVPYYAAALAQGHSEEDTAALCAVLEDMARLTRD